MKISKLALIALLGGALMAFGCSDDSETGTGGTGGTGGTAGSGGEGGGGGGVAACLPPAGSCTNGDIDATVPCCELDTPPDVADVCDGTESLENPASCTATGTVVTHTLTQFEINGDCNAGYDLDSCNGQSCINGGLAPGEGMEGVDNALAGLAPVLVGVGGNLGGVNQAFSDALCGLSGDACDQQVTPLDIGFAVDANLEENCANVGLLIDGQEAGSVILNVSDPVDGNVCASGTLGTIPVEIGGTPGTFGNAVIQMTISGGGFSNGKLGATVDQTTAVAIAEALLEGAGAVVAQVLDINDDLSGDNENGCSALSGTYTVGGVVVDGGGAGGAGGAPAQ
jgi:hypothetical protein